MGDCIVRLNQLIDQLSPGGGTGGTLFAGPLSRGHAANPIEKVSEACQTSKTTVVRLCKQLGFKGYKALSIALSMELASGGENRISYQDINPGDNIHTIIERVSQHTQAAIADTVRVLREEDVLRAVDALDKAKRVDFYGAGTSALVALDAQQKFQRLCRDTQTSTDPHVQVVIASRLERGDAAVFFSYSGETEDMLDTLAVAKRGGAVTISVTRYGVNRLSRGADIPLYVASSEMLVRSAAMTSRIAMMHVVDILYSAVAAQGYDRYKPFLDKTHLAGREKRRNQHERRR